MGWDSWINAPRAREWQGVDAQRFASEVQPAGEPAVLRGLVAQWPAVQAGQESAGALTALLRRHATAELANVFVGGPESAGRFTYNDDYSGFNFERRQLALADLLDLLQAEAGQPHPRHVYAGGMPVPQCAPGLLAEHQHGLLDAKVEQLVSLWLGNPSRTAAHFDLPQNIAAVVYGRRRFILLPMSQLPNLYLGPLELTPAGQPVSLVDFLNPDLQRHPLFDLARAHALVAELEPGDALYLPGMWFHHVESLDPLGLMMNFWWRDAPDYMFTPMITLFHALLSVKGLPAAEREAWRVMFDHYIFERHGEPMAHLPAAARGMFGELTPQRLQRLRHYLARALGARD